MDPTDFDRFVRSLSWPTSRRGALGGVVAAALALLSDVAPGAAKRGQHHQATHRRHRAGKRRHAQANAAKCAPTKTSNSACAKACAQLFGANTPAASQCTSQAAKCQGLCYQCGPGCTGNCSTLCGQQCVDTQTDTSHCGGCDQPCPDGKTCQGGFCSCPPPTTECTFGSGCVDLQTDEENCGFCNFACDFDGWVIRDSASTAPVRQATTLVRSCSGRATRPASVSAW